MGIIFAQLDDELPARHLVDIDPSSTVAATQAAVRTAFNLPEGGDVQLAFGGRALADPSTTLAVGEVPADAVLEASKA
jgi:hypothetical protein